MVKRSKRVYVKSFGCSANIADGEVIAGCLSNAGFVLVEDPKAAEFLVFNSCGVKSQTENRIINLLKKTPKDKKLVVTGCLPLINFDRLNNEVDFDGVMGPAPGDKIVDILRRVDSGNKVVSLDNDLQNSLSLPRIPMNSTVSIIPINYGCLGNCSYCCVHFARGKLRSNTIDDIVKRVERDLVSGISEFWLTSQDTACYGKDIGTSLPDLLGRICEIKGEFFIRLGMMNPDQVLNILNDLVESYNDRKVFKFLHLPVQSGDDDILKLMNRHYTVNDFKRIVLAFRESIPRLTLSTDVICGFPGENKEAFKKTKKLLAEIKPDIVNVSKFFSRPRTPAEKLSPIVPEELNFRSRELAELSKRISFEKNKSWIGWEGVVLFDECGKDESWVGRNFAYKPIVVKSGESLIGGFGQVRVVNSFSTYLGAQLV
jgi:MiaB-like tRNA modifying enzyme